ncbi:MAG TPA: hypothetical protein VMV06_00655 [Acidimicrobiales bacterium]|nr:hypothetical protein [Acidimicrobiales bacterium]
MRKWLIRYSIPLLVALIASTILAITGSPSGAQAATALNPITFRPSGADGNADLDIQRANGRSGPRQAYWGVVSTVGFDRKGYFHVRTEIGSVATGSLTMGIAGRINGNATSTDPASPIDTLDWVHETPSMAYDAVRKTWVVVYYSYPKQHPTMNDVYGNALPQYSWIARKVIPNRTGISYLRPNLDKMPAKEDRVLCATACSGALYNSTRSWAKGIPQSVGTMDGVTYILYAEPGIIADAAGHIWMSITGMHNIGTVANPDFVGDVLLFKSTNDGASWKFIARTLNYTDAAQVGASYYTGSQLHEIGSNVYLDVSPALSSNGTYHGLVEFKYTSLSNGTVVHRGSHPKAYYSANDPSCPQVGSGGYFPPTGRHQMTIVCTGQSTHAFKVYEAD